MLFEKDELGTAMYIIVDGRVQVHDGELVLTHLGTGQVFGEMAALDVGEVRSASITAVEKTRLITGSVAEDSAGNKSSQFNSVIGAV
jgi:CRP-like cAMP-binding protein